MASLPCAGSEAPLGNPNQEAQFRDHNYRFLLCPLLVPLFAIADLSAFVGVNVLEIPIKIGANR